LRFSGKLRVFFGSFQEKKDEPEKANFYEVISNTRTRKHEKRLCVAGQRKLFNLKSLGTNLSVRARTLVKVRRVTFVHPPISEGDG